MLYAAILIALVLAPARPVAPVAPAVDSTRRVAVLAEPVDACCGQLPAAPDTEEHDDRHPCDVSCHGVCCHIHIATGRLSSTHTATMEVGLMAAPAVASLPRERRDSLLRPPRLAA